MTKLTQVEKMLTPEPADEADFSKVPEHDPKTKKLDPNKQGCEDHL